MDERRWVAQDANYNITAIFDNAGNVVERYAYDPFGSVTVLDENWNVQAGGSAFAWFHLHQGGRFDATSGLYHFRHRDYSPTLGRWTSLDPIRYTAGDVNLYRALGNGLPNCLDPSGLYLYLVQVTLTDTAEATHELYNLASIQFCNTTYTFTDPIGNSTQFVFAEGWRLTQEIDPLGNSTFYSYTSDGLLVSQTLLDKILKTIK